MKNLVSNILFLVSEKLLTTLILLFSNIIVIRYLGVEEFGKLAIFQIYFALSITVSEFGIRRVYSSFRTRFRERITFKEVLLLKSIFSSICFLLTCIIVFFSGFDNIYYLLSLAFLAAPLETYSYHFEANLNNQLLSKIRVVVSLFLAVLRIILCWLSVDLIFIVLSFTLNNILINLLCYFQAKHRGFNPIKVKSPYRRNIIRKHLFNRSIFFWISVVVVQLNLRTDQFMLSLLSGASSVGIYAGAYKLIEQFMMIPSILAGVFLPHVSKQKEIDKGQYLERLYYFSVLISLPMSLIAAILAPYFIPLLLGTSFTASVAVFQYLALSLPVLILVNLSGLYYSVNKLERYAVFRNLFGLLLSLVLNALFIKLFGVTGAALSVLISYTFVAFVIELAIPATRKNVYLKYQAVKNIFSLQAYKVLIKDAKNKTFKKG